MDRKGPISDPDIEITPTMPDTVSSRKLLVVENTTPVKSLSREPMAKVLFLPIRSAKEVRNIVMKRSPTMMRVRRRPI